MSIDEYWMDKMENDPEFRENWEHYEELSDSVDYPELEVAN